jgi:hypothetical protein
MERMTDSNTDGEEDDAEEQDVTSTP